jgi:hypothetical protein
MVAIAKAQALNRKKHFLRRFKKIISDLLFLLFKAITQYPNGHRSHDPQLQSPWWQAETLPLDNAAMPAHSVPTLFVGILTRKN